VEHSRELGSQRTSLARKLNRGPGFPPLAPGSPLGSPLRSCSPARITKLPRQPEIKSQPTVAAISFDTPAQVTPGNAVATEQFADFFTQPKTS
jgi:hypothetical protein